MSRRKQPRIEPEIVSFCADCGHPFPERMLPWCAHARVLDAPEDSPLYLAAMRTGRLLEMAHRAREEMNRLLAKHDRYNMSRAEPPPNVLLLFPTEKEESRRCMAPERRPPMSRARALVYRLRRGGRFDPRRVNIPVY